MYDFEKPPEPTKPYILSLIEGKSLSPQRVQLFAEAVEMLIERMAQNLALKGEYTKSKTEKVDDDIIPGNKIEKTTEVTVDLAAINTEAGKSILRNLESAGNSLSFTEVSSFIRKVKLGHGLDLDVDPNTDLGTNANLSEEEQAKYVSLEISRKVHASFEEIFNPLVLSENGLSERHNTESFVREFIEFSEKYRSAREMLPGLKYEYAAFGLERQMHYYLSHAIEIERDENYDYKDFMLRLDALQVLTKKHLSNREHIDAIEVAIDKCLGKNESEFDLSGSPENVVERIESGEEISMNPKVFERHYKAYIKSKLNHTKTEEYDRDWKKAEERVLEDYPELAAKLGRDRG